MKSLTEHLWFEVPQRRGFVNITDTVQKLVRKSGVQDGICLVNAMHITAAVFINDAEQGLLHDYDVWLEKLAPHEPTSQYRHNRNSWAPMNTVRYLCEKKEALNPDWRKDARTLIDFVNKRFTTIHSGVLVCGEQDDDTNPWGGAVSTYGGVLAVYSKATGSDEFKGLAWQVLNYALYSIDDDGCPSEAVWKGRRRGGWQEDAHTDKLHNYVDAMNAFPEWAN